MKKLYYPLPFRADTFEVRTHPNEFFLFQAMEIQFYQAIHKRKTAIHFRLN